MSLRGFGRMVIVPAALAVVVGVLLEPLGAPARWLSVTLFFAAQLAVLAHSYWRLRNTRRQLGARRVQRKVLRLERRV